MGIREYLFGCQCWACKNIRAGGGYQPCHKLKNSGELAKPPRRP